MSNQNIQRMMLQLSKFVGFARLLFLLASKEKKEDSNEIHSMANIASVFQISRGRRFTDFILLSDKTVAA
jgi:hypothetical protein